MKLTAYFDQGDQGIVFETNESRILAKVFVAELVPTDIERRVNTLVELRLWRRDRSLRCLPQDMFSIDGYIGHLMERAKGEKVIPRLLGVTLKDVPLVERLRLATDLARGMSELHRRGVIHADIHNDNLFVRLEPALLEIIDADGFGLEGVFGPSVYGHGTTQAPELLADKTRWPSESTDLWSLAVVIHKILLVGRDPFPGDLYDLYRDVLNTKMPKNWPPDRLNPLLHNLGSTVTNMFKQVFGVTRVASIVGKKEPTRPSAESWTEILELAMMFAGECPNCHTESIWVDLDCCPKCKAGMPVALAEKLGRLIRPRKPLSADIGAVQARLELVQSGRRLVQALADIRKAVGTDNDEVIAKTWQRYQPILKGFRPADVYKGRAKQAVMRIEALAELSRAIESDVDETIIAAWSRHKELLRDHAPARSHLKRVRLAERRIQAAGELVRAIERGNEETIIEVWRRHKALLKDHPTAKAHRQRVDQAERRVTALGHLFEALESNGDLRIAEVWARHRKLFQDFPSALAHRDRVKLAEQRSLALRRLRRVLREGHDRTVSDTYMRDRQLLEPSMDFSDRERKAVLAAQRRLAISGAATIREAIWEKDDEKIANAFEATQFDMTGVLTKGELRIVDLARRRMEVLKVLREALKRDDRLLIVDIHNENEQVLRPCRAFTGTERKMVAEAKCTLYLASLRDAIRGGDEKEIVSAGQRAIAAGCDLGEREWQAMLRGRACLRALQRLQDAAEAGNDREIVEAYDREIFDRCKGFSRELEARVGLARERLNYLPLLRQAFARGDEVQISRLYDSRLFTDCTLFTSEERDIAERARARSEALKKLRDALRSNDDKRILDAYDESLLGSSQLVTDWERERINEARDRIARLEALRNALRERDPLAIATAYEAAVDSGVPLPARLNWDAILSACKQARAIHNLRQALSINNDAEIASSWSPIRFSEVGGLTQGERERARLAFRRTGALARLRGAIAIGDQRLIRRIYRPELLASIISLIEEEEQVGLSLRAGGEA